MIVTLKVVLAICNWREKLNHNVALHFQLRLLDFFEVIVERS